MSPPLLLGSPVFGSAAPTILPPPTGGPGPGWTVIEEFEENSGDLPDLENDVTTITRNNGFFWNPEGTLFTIANTSDDWIRTYQTTGAAWDLSNLTRIASISVTNASNLKVNTAGSRMTALIIVGDEIAEYALSNFTVTNNTQQSDITKSNAGFTGSTDGRFTMSNDFATLLWEGVDAGGDASKEISLSPDLDNFIVQQTYNNAAINPGAGDFSPMTADGKEWYKCLGSPGIGRRVMTTAYDPSTVTNWSDTYSLAGLTQIDCRPNEMWFNPEDTSEVWVAQDTGGNLKFSRYATNVEG